MCVSFQLLPSVPENLNRDGISGNICGRGLARWSKAAAEAHHIIQTLKNGFLSFTKERAGSARVGSESFQLVVNASERVQSIWTCSMMTFSMDARFFFCEMGG